MGFQSLGGISLTTQGRKREKKFFLAMKKDPLPPTSLEYLLLVKNKTAMEARNS